MFITKKVTKVIELPSLQRQEVGMVERVNKTLDFDP